MSPSTVQDLNLSAIVSIEISLIQRPCKGSLSSQRSGRVATVPRFPVPGARAPAASAPSALLALSPPVRALIGSSRRPGVTQRAQTPTRSAAAPEERDRNAPLNPFVTQRLSSATPAFTIEDQGVYGGKGGLLEKTYFT